MTDFCGKYLGTCQFYRTVANLNTADFYDDATIAGFTCGDDSYLAMMSKVTDIGIWFFSVFKETIAFLMPPNTRIAIEYFWQGSAGGLNAWIAYFFATIYYLTKGGFGEVLCKYSALLNAYVEGLWNAIDFAPTTSSSLNVLKKGYTCTSATPPVCTRNA